MDFWIGATIAAIIGFALGALVVWLIDRKRGGGTSVAALKQEHEEFREKVTTHFVETADLINKLTDSYKDVFDHLSKGAETLVDDESLRDRMPRVSDQEVRLKRLGSRTPQSGKDARGGTGSARDSRSPGEAKRSDESRSPAGRTGDGGGSGESPPPGSANRGPSRGETKRAGDPRPASTSPPSSPSPTAPSASRSGRGDRSSKGASPQPSNSTPATRKPPSKS
ncbi:ZapG family protein [Halomonas denitrificans]|nr:DUF1043 family protein [Halomonas denitrificans]